MSTPSSSTPTTHYTRAIALQRHISNTIVSQAALGAIDPLVYEGWEILFNKVSQLHTNMQDPPYNWVVLTTFGTTSTVEMQLPQLNLCVTFNPGDLLAIHGRVLNRSTNHWDAGQHIVIPHFTYASSWSYTGFISAFSHGMTLWQCLLPQIIIYCFRRLLFP